MPIVATSRVRGDPFLPELNALAESVARVAFGSDMAGAARWAPLLARGDYKAPEGLPATAYPNGPVVTERKPQIEQLEFKG